MRIDDKTVYEQVYERARKGFRWHREQHQLGFDLGARKVEGCCSLSQWATACYWLATTGYGLIQLAAGWLDAAAGGWSWLRSARMGQQVAEGATELQREQQ